MYETFSKSGKRSKKRAVDRPGMRIRKPNMYTYCPPLGGGPEAFERAFQNQYRKVTLPSLTDTIDELGDEYY